MGRSGELVNNLSGEAAYRSFRPTPLPPNPELNVRLLDILEIPYELGSRR